MNPDIPFETALQLLAMAYLTSVMLLLVATKVGLAIIETLEEARTHPEPLIEFQKRCTRASQVRSITNTQV